MFIAALFFYLFALMVVLSGAMVVLARNPVHAVLFLILAFFNSAGLFILLGAEFLAMLLVVVYVGAVAVLFLFVVMMLDIDATAMRQGFRQNLPIGAAVGCVLMAELLLVFLGGGHSGSVLAIGHGGASNTTLIGRQLYTEYLLLFQLAGLILLVAMIGAITLTMRHREGVKRQSIAKQNRRTRGDTIAIVSVESGAVPDALEDAPAAHKKLQ